MELNVAEYKEWLRALKIKISNARRNVVISVNTQIHELYWQIGKEIAIKQSASNWGSKFIEQTASDLKNEFPDIKGFSRRNIYAMLQWYKFYSSKYEIVPQSVAQIPWGHNRLIISKVKYVEEAEFYAEQTVINGWSRDSLEIQIESSLYQRQGSLENNFDQTLPQDQSLIVSQILKDPYNFDFFLGLHEDALEKAIEDELVKNITNFLLELGKGFAFVGKQYKIEISETDYFIDLLFYHLELRCFIVIELKAGKFKPEYAGKLNFYLSAVDSQLKQQQDSPSIGILLCKKKDKIEAEYALRDMNKPMGVAEYRLTDDIPENIQTKLPTIEQLEEELTRQEKKKK